MYKRQSCVSPTVAIAGQKVSIKRHGPVSYTHLIAELIMRITIALTLPLLIGKQGIYYAETGAWLGAAILLVAAYYWRIRRLGGDA